MEHSTAGIHQAGGLCPDGLSGSPRKKTPDATFEAFLPIISHQAYDKRNFVKKAVNWALRQIGKRNLHLNQLAIHTAEEMRGQDSGAARWIANDALRELNGQKVQEN